MRSKVKLLKENADLIDMLKFLTLLTFAYILIGHVGFAGAASGAGLTYHGRLVGPDGTPTTSTNVQFRLQIRTSGSENCLMFEEIQSKDLTNSNGVFAITINDGSGARQDSTGYSLDQIFANRGGFSFPGGYCASGSTFTPNPSDGRMLQVYFNDGSFSGWEPVPSQAINFVPMAIESMQVGGYKKEQILKTANGVDATGFDLNAAAFAELIALVNGTSTQFVKPGAANFTAAPQWSGTPSSANDLANKSYVDAQVASGLPNIGTAGTYTKVTTDTKGRVTSGTTLAATDIPSIDASKITSGVLPIANGGTNSSAALSGSKVMVSSASAIVEGMASNTAKSNNTFVMRDGTGNIAAALGTFDGLSVLLGGSLSLNGATSGSVSIAAPTTVTSYTMTLPGTAGSNGQVLTTNGTGVLSWSAPSSGLPASTGTAAAPGYAFSGNTNTGMFGAATNQIGFSTNGSERVRIDASGNVGIGTTSPSGTLDVTGTGGIVYHRSGAGSAIAFSDYGGSQPIITLSGTDISVPTALASAGPFRIYAGSTNLASAGAKLAIAADTTGNVGIGTTTPNSTLQVGNQITLANDQIGINAYWNGANWKELYSSGASIFGSNGLGTYVYWSVAGPSSVGATITPVTAIAVSTTSGSVGNVGIGTTAPSAKLDVTGQIVSRSYNAGASTSFDFNNGNIQYTSASCGAMTLSNVLDGGSYTLAVQGATSGTCTFTAAGYTFRYTPANAATTAASHTLYSMQVIGTIVYVSWITGI